MVVADRFHCIPSANALEIPRPWTKPSTIQGPIAWCITEMEMTYFPQIPEQGPKTLSIQIFISFKKTNVRKKTDNSKIKKTNLRNLINAIGLYSNRIQIVDFSARVTLKFDGWPQKIIGHHFYTTSSFVYHFVAFGPCHIWKLSEKNLLMWER